MSNIEIYLICEKSFVSRESELSIILVFGISRRRKTYSPLCRNVQLYEIHCCDFGYRIPKQKAKQKQVNKKMNGKVQHHLEKSWVKNFILCLQLRFVAQFKCYSTYYSSLFLHIPVHGIIFRCLLLRFSSFL